LTIYNDVLFDYQKLAVDRIVEREIALLADQPGLGKTLEVLSSLEELKLFTKPGQMTLILTPIVAAQTAWRDTIERYLMPSSPVEIIDLSYGTTPQRVKRYQDAMQSDSGLPAIVIANHALLEWKKGKGPRVPQLFETHFTAIVIDESHLVLPILNDRKLTTFWLGLSKFSYVQHRIAVSGTPDRGKLENRYGTYKFLKPATFAKYSRWAWLEENFWVYEKQVARNRTIKAIGTLKNERRWADNEDDVIIRRTKKEVLKDLPDKQYNYVEIELSKEQKLDYGQAIKNAYEDKQKALEDDRVTASAMVFALRARQISSCQWTKDPQNPVPLVGGKSSKLEWLIEWLNERGFDEGRGKVVIASQFSMVLGWLQTELSALGYNSAVIDGSTPQLMRTQLQHDFQDGDLNIMLLSGRMGVGITLDAADDLIMFDLPYDPDMIEQIEDRVHRASRNHQVVIWNLLAIGTIDQAVAQKVSKRYQITRQSMDGRRGIDFEKKILEKIRVLSKMSDGHDSVNISEGEKNG
jgi:SNF2 family DNA or RNA helicase